MTEIPSQSFRMPGSDAKKYLEQASALMKIGNYQEAIPLYESALASLERMHGSDQPETAECLQELGEAYEAGYRLSDALRIHTRLLKLGERVLGKNNPNVVAMHFKLCQINEMLGRPADALACCTTALEAAKQCLAQDDPLSQQIIDRYRYLTTLIESQPQSQSHTPASGQQTPDWSGDLSRLPLDSNEIVGRAVEGQMAISNMQDFAREMLSDMGAPSAPLFNPSMVSAQMPKHQISGEEIPEHEISAQQMSFQQLPVIQPPQQLMPSGQAHRPDLAAPDMVAPTSFSAPTSFGRPPEGGPVETSAPVINESNFASNFSRPSGGNPLDVSSAAFPASASDFTANFENLPAPQTPLSHTDSSASYKSILEAGFTNAQQASLPSAFPNDAYAGMSGSAPPPPPAYEPGGEGYSLADLDDIRAGRRSTSESYTEIKPSRVRRISEGENKQILYARLAKDFALPAVGVLVLIGVTLFMLFGTKPAEHKAAPAATGPAKTAAVGVYRTADGDKEIRLVDSDTAQLVARNSAEEVPYMVIDNNFGALMTAIASSASEKQIWAEQKDFGLKTQDDVSYYTSDGAEAKVIAKMKRLSGAVQSYFLKHGEYPRYVPVTMASDFAFVNPNNNQGVAIPIRTLLSQTSDASDARSGLESGLELGLAPDSEQVANIHNPSAITCYAVVVGKAEDNLEQMRATKFFIRGCDRDGNFLSSGLAGRSYVVPADNQYLSAVTPATSPANTAGASAKARGKTRGHTTGKLAESAPKPQAADVESVQAPVLTPVHAEKPSKNTKLLIAVRPMYPMVLLHHTLPLVLVILAVLAFIRAGMAQDDPTGTSISSTRDTMGHYAKIAGMIFAGLAFIVIVAQFLVFG